MESNVPLQAHGERVERPPQNRQKKMAIASGVGIVMLGTVSTVLAVTLSNKQFSAVFLDSCKKLKGGIFASIEAPRLSSKHVKKLKVVLVTQPGSVTNCETASLKDLQKQLDQGIVYNCQEVPEAKVQECASNPHIACGACW
ncbi:hypothetical protein D9C73_021664 [Collichthys lucidus]|uniref:ADP-ribosyl cyclase/cyclic ADP-ribose hydrolase n=1 Tax=Collichthys lucidus TaxID=240159 RepID=A0A4U5VIE2_COLLU|nr:hypothetical protein D9C73_021664 [Collichthys lucidus]